MGNREKEVTYRLWELDHIMYAPVPLAQLIQWTKEERVTPDHWVFIEPDNRWQKAADVPGLQTIFRNRTSGSRGAAEGAGLRSRSPALKPEALQRLKSFAGMNQREIESFVRYTEVLHCEQFSHVGRKG